MAYSRNNYQDKWRIERESAAIRGRIGLDQIEILDPRQLVEHVGASLFLLSDLAPDPDTLRAYRQLGFDGCCGPHPVTGETMILLNCGKPPTRRTATLMEELAHLLLDHAPSRISSHGGVMKRTYNQSQENEAYDLGAALLLPKERIQRDVKERQLLAAQIAAAHACSIDLVNYRIRRMQLWARYKTYAQLPA